MKNRLTGGGFVAAAAVALWSLPATANAHAGNNDPALLHVCIGNVSKVVRSVGVSGSCIAGPPVVAETPAHWLREGIPGIPGPKGDKGDPGEKGETGDSGTNATRADGPCFDHTNRYVDCGNGTVTDTATGLIWLKNPSCLPPNDWPGANQAAAALKASDCGLTDKSSPGDWRLPTEAEWKATIARAVAMGCRSALFGGPSLTNDAGTGCYGDGTSSSLVGVTWDYWTSTSDESALSWARIADLSGGFTSIGSKTNTDRTWWPVRGGQR